MTQKNRAVMLGVFGISTYPSEEPTDLYRSISNMYKYVNIHQSKSNKDTSNHESNYIV
jgi:23S rRNA U2552 (ribose-2'-O)-methylase RlmE/FtsJ